MMLDNQEIKAVEVKKQAMSGNAMLGNTNTAMAPPPPPSGLCAHINTARNQIPVLHECVEILISLDARINGERPQPSPDDGAVAATDGMADDLGRIVSEITGLADHIRSLIAGIHDSL